MKFFGTEVLEWGLVLRHFWCPSPTYDPSGPPVRRGDRPSPGAPEGCERVEV